jgi:transcriptional regulator with GAF, ATPase, and Fis domain
MNAEALQPALLSLANQRSINGVLNTIVESLAAQEHVALARIWLIEQGELCNDTARPTGYLQLAASDGQSLDATAPPWSNLKGSFSRFAVGDRKVGGIAATGEPIFLTNIEDNAAWMRDPDWGRRERILSFAGQPLIFRGEVLGTLAVFSREILCADTLTLLRTFADHAAAAYANARAFEEIDCLRQQLELENAYLREEVMEVHAHGAILGDSSALTKVLRQIDLVARTDSTVLIEGESGTGKELIARAIHEHSERSNRPMIKVNCASISKDLFESEFFGHVRGSFTGALKDRAGRFELADGGTLFLDEVGEIPLDLQGKLLRVIQEGEFERVGDEATRTVDVRIIAATNRALKKEADRGAFRQDLYFRLSVFPVESPALRERQEDIPLLAAHFLQRAANRFQVPLPVLKQRHVMQLQQYGWPGNVRELQNVMERAAITAQHGVLSIDLPRSAELPQSTSIQVSKGVEATPLTYPEFREFERENLRKALKQTDGKVAGKGGAAELLEANPTTLASRIKRFGLEKPRH